MKLWLLWLAAATAAAGLLAANLIFGNLNQDEGWYLYAAGLISGGQMPYRDFAFTQGPTLPYLYSLFTPLIAWGGLAAGRLLTAGLGLLGITGAAILAGRLARPGQGQWAALLCFVLLAVNVYQSYFCTVVKTYSPAILFLAGAFLALHSALVGRRRLATVLAAGLLVIAAGARSSAAIILPVIFILLWLQRKQLNFAAWLYFALGGVLAALLVFGAFLLQCPDNFIYFVMRYHTLRHEGGLLNALVFKGGFLSRLLQAYFVCFVVWVAAMVLKLSSTSRAGPPCPPEAEQPGGQSSGSVAAMLLRRALWLGAIAVSLVHFFAPFPYDDYQVFVYPLFALAVSGMFIDAFFAAGPGQATQNCKRAVLAVFCLALAAAVSSPVNQEWFIEGRELIWWRTKDKPALVKLRQAAAKIRAVCKESELLLTQDPYLAVEAQCKLPHGLEMGQFSYFPGLTTEQALKLNVLNRELFIDLLRNCPAPAAAFSGYGFAMQAPRIIPVSAEDKALFKGILSNRYELLETIPHFGQAATELKLYKIKK